MVAFRVALAVNGLEVLDLWNAGRPPAGPPKAGAVNFVGVAMTLTNACFVLAALTLLYGMVLVTIACIHRDAKAVVVGGASVVLSVISGLLAFQLGLVIAGV